MARTSSLALVAQWLVEEVGEGNVFTKQDLRMALPQFEQADRRMRDLRDYGWRILTNREDAGLRPNELRLLEVGLPVWDSDVVRTVKRADGRLSPAERSRELLAAGYLCRRCGIAAGDFFPEAKTLQASLSVRKSEGSFIVLCQLCARGDSDPLAALKVAIAKLDANDKVLLKTWLIEGRTPAPIEVAWSLAKRAQIGEILDLL